VTVKSLAQYVQLSAEVNRTIATDVCWSCLHWGHWDTWSLHSEWSSTCPFVSGG